MIRILEIKTGRISAVVSVEDGNEVEVLECSNYTNCKIQGVVSGNLSDGCPKFCPVFVLARKQIKRVMERERMLKKP